MLGRGPDEAFIGTYFNDAYGGPSKPNSVLRWWPYGIWAHYNDVETSEQCAFRCYIRKVDNCAFYYWGSGYCHLGHFNGRWHKLVGGYDGNTKYHIRKDFSKAVASLDQCLIDRIKNVKKFEIHILELRKFKIMYVLLYL